VESGVSRRAMADGLGNLLRHEYRRIDPAILWSIIEDHLDALDQAAADLLNKSEN
jgi:uncharacterized protein with HEPN domain